MENEPELADDVVSVLIGQSHIMWPSVQKGLVGFDSCALWPNFVCICV